MSSPNDRIITKQPEESDMENTKLDRVLEIFFRGLRGEDLSVQKLADEYEVSTKSITRSINDLKNFLADHRELVGHTELQYIYEFFNSKDIAAHCKKIGHTFTALEMAYIIFRSEYHTLEQKHNAWQYLIDHYPDEYLPEGKWLDDDGEVVRKERSLHKFLQHYIEIEQRFLADFPITRKGYVYEYAIMYSGEIRYQPNDMLYDNYEACFAAIKEEMETYTVGARITRRRLYVIPSEVGLDEVTIHMNAALAVMSVDSLLLDDDWAIKDGFSDIWFRIPTPFQRGDFVTCNRVDKEKQEKFVLLHALKQVEKTIQLKGNKLDPILQDLQSNIAASL